jgi:hypothetical protein
LVAAVLGASAPVVAADGLALTPPMGWNSWNKFGCDVSETLMKEMADALLATGMKDAGYQYLVIDDCWQVRRDDQGRIVADPARFPSGLRALADYVHSNSTGARSRRRSPCRGTRSACRPRARRSSATSGRERTWAHRPAASRPGSRRTTS